MNLSKINVNNKSTADVVYEIWKDDIIFTETLTNTYDARIKTAVRLKVKIRSFEIWGKVENQDGSTEYIDSVQMWFLKDTTNYKSWSEKRIDENDGTYHFKIENISDDVYINVDFSVGYDVVALLYNNHGWVHHYVTSFKYSVNPYDSPIVQSSLELSTFQNMIECELCSYGNVFKADSQIVINSTGLNQYSLSVIKDGVSPFDGYITEICFELHGLDGIYSTDFFRIYVGFLDQKNIFIPSYDFTIDVYLPNGDTVFAKKLEVNRYFIKQGQQLMIENKSVNGHYCLKYKQRNESSPEMEWYYGGNRDTKEYTMYRLATVYGGAISWSYSIVKFDNPFASKQDITDLHDSISDLSQIVNTQNHVYDSAGNAYKIIVVDGELQIKSMTYKKVLGLGNSLTSHGASPSALGYYGDSSWAMASTNKVRTTWTNQFERILAQKMPDAEVTPFNIYTWEANYMTCDLNSLFSQFIGTNFDLIIIRAGENGSAGSDYAEGVDRLVTFLRTNFSTADIIITKMFWPNATKDAGFREIAEKYGYKYVTYDSISDSLLLGQMIMGYDDVMHPVVNSGVSGHCTDVCFYDFANYLADAISYPKLNEKHTVTVSSTVTYNLNNTYQIYMSYVSILTYGNAAPIISASASGNSIEITTYDLSSTNWISQPNPVPKFASVFQMPNADVTVTIS